MQPTLFSQISQDIQSQGYSIRPGALPKNLLDQLTQHLQDKNETTYIQAGIGRNQQATRNTTIRSDDICWITGESEAEENWLSWATELQLTLNRQLFLGMFSFESHFAHYKVGDFYKRHVDAFKGESNRILSLIVYLNPTWNENDGGELILYTSSDKSIGIKVPPKHGTVVAFLSEEFPHEVLPTHKDRYSIAGWFRVNTSTSKQIDPPK